MQQAEVRVGLGSGPRPRLPAVVASLSVHLLLLLTVGLWWQPAPRGLSTDSTDAQWRGVEVVLSRRPDGPPIAWEQPTLDPSLASESQASSAASAAAGGAQPAELPTPESASQRPLVELPDLRGPALPAGPATGDLAAGGLGRGLPRGPDQAARDLIAQDRAQLAARRPVGNEGQLAVFGSAPARGRSFVFVVDRSQSMGAQGLGALDAAGEELFRALSQLEPTHRFQIVVYHHARVVFSPDGLVPATEDNLQRVRPFFGTLAAFGSTDHALGVLAGLRFKPDVLFLLTDGGDPPIRPNQLAEIRDRNRGRTAIHCVQFGFASEPQEGGFMRELASQQRGSYTYVRVRRR